MQRHIVLIYVQFVEMHELLNVSYHQNVIQIRGTSCGKFNCELEGTKDILSGVSRTRNNNNRQTIPAQYDPLSNAAYSKFGATLWVTILNKHCINCPTFKNE